jgi:glycine betaine/proline transport system ATP-binding protein
MRLGDRIAMLRGGQVMQIGTAEDILTDPANDFDPDTTVAEVFTRCAESPFPVPVADGDGKLLGVIPRVTLLAALDNLNGNAQNEEVAVDA